MRSRPHVRIWIACRQPGASVPAARAPIWMRRSRPWTPARCPPPNAATSRRWTCAPHLHLGHHGAAEGGERQSSPHSELGWMVCRATDASVDDRLSIACRSIIPWGGVVAPCSMLRAGGSVVIAEKFSGTRLLGRHRAFRLHRLPIYRRALPLPAEAPASRPETQHDCGWPCGNGLRGDIWEAFAGRFANPSYPRILRRDGRQFFAVQRRRKTRRDRPDSAAAGASLSRLDREGRCRQRQPVRGEDGLLHRLRPR